MTVTRDSALWWWGKVVGLCSLIVAGAADPSAGVIDLSAFLSPLAVHRVQVIAGLVVFVSAQFSTSALPGKHQQPLRHGSKRDGPATGMTT